MTFINPIDILELQNYSTTEIDSSMIKKAKRKLFANIDLSDDGLFDYKGILLTKADCEAAINNLENFDNISLYSYLANKNQLLNNFLINGDKRFFSKIQQEYLYNLPEFVNFISPYFAQQFDKVLLKTFAEFTNGCFNSEIDTIDILQTQLLIATSDINTAFKSLSIEITNRIKQTEKITREIKNETSDYTDDNIEDIETLVKNLFPRTFLNHLPSYFLSQINKIAASINFLQLAIWDTFNNSSVCRSLLEYILDLKIESVSKRTFEKNYEIVKKADEKRREQKKLQQYIDKLNTIVDSFEKKSKTISNARELIYQAKPYLFNIKAISQEANDAYINLITRVASVAQDFVIEDVNEERASDNSFSSDLSKIGLRDFLLKLTLTSAWEVMQLIGTFEMQYNFVINRYNPNHKTLQDICSKYNIAKPQLVLGKIPKCNFIILDGTITHTDKDCKTLEITNPFIRSDIRYIGLDLKIETFDNQSVKFNLKYIQPNGMVKIGTSSPVGFSFSNDININTSTKIINFSGWGNNEKGTYDVGTHHIEVWIDNCMIYRKSFEVDWSQEEKVENAKREVEKREREKIETEKRKEQERIKVQKVKDKKIRVICIYIMSIFICSSIIFGVWGTDGLIVFGIILGFLLIFGFQDFLKMLKEIKYE